MGQQVTQVDAFTDSPFAGNPAAVCLLPAPRERTWMMAVAREMNLSETAFLVPRADGAFDLRWFTPEVEVDLCGHATLASAHVLWESAALDRSEQACFHTRSGLLTAALRGDWIEMDFPATPAGSAVPPPGLLEALGLESASVARSRFDYLVEVETEEAVRRLSPDMAGLQKVETRGVIVTARSNSPAFDFVSRFFAPGAGIPEDPVTGSAHCCLGPYWAERLRKTEMTGYQASARGGVVGMRVERDRVFLSGKAVTVMRAELLA
jgi:predicted PhzF superfamily epimerase YddE/YHI9